MILWRVAQTVTGFWLVSVCFRHTDTELKGFGVLIACAALFLLHEGGWGIYRWRLNRSVGS